MPCHSGTAFHAVSPLPVFATSGNCFRHVPKSLEKSISSHGPRRATGSQVKAIHAIAGRNRIDVARLVQDRFSVQRPDDLSISDASTLIDELKAAQTGASR